MVQSHKDRFSSWRLCSELTIDEAAQLMIGVLPGETEAHYAVGSELLPNESVRYTTELRSARQALLRALRSKEIKGEPIPNTETNWRADSTRGITEYQEKEGEISLDSIVEVDSVKLWLEKRGVYPGFFFPQAPDYSGNESKPNYLNPNHPRYSPKLAAAIEAWQAIEDSGRTSPKQKVKTWLKENAARFDGMTHKDGRVNARAVDEVAKIVNWNTRGGAPKTPSGVLPSQDSDPEVDDIPF
jgi:hypothetical protein